MDMLGYKLDMTPCCVVMGQVEFELNKTIIINQKVSVVTILIIIAASQTRIG